MTIASLTILAPLAAFVVILIFRRWAAMFAIAGAAGTVIAGIVTIIRVKDGSRFSATLPGLPGTPLHLQVNPLTISLAVTVAVIALLVLMYAVGYMEAEPDQTRFFAEMSFFITAMTTLTLAGDWILFLVAWELVALASYFLIGFHFAEPEAGSSGTRAFLTLRVTDLGLYTAIFLLVSQMDTTNIGATMQATGTEASIASILLIIAAMGKAAQTPFQGWLERAMVGPTPVSALLHSATMVAAGVILLIRAFPLLENDALIVIGLVGAITTVTTGLIALQERDLKKMLAASTSSQLALMFIAIGAGSWIAALVHLTTHAVMKSALFLGAGIFQHSRESTAFADLAGIGREQKRSFTGFAIAGLALAGVPPLVGFWSKDAIVSAAMTSSDAWWLGTAALVGTLLTGGYIGRALGLLWRGNGDGTTPAGLGWMAGALFVLATATVVLGTGENAFTTFLGEHAPRETLSLVLSLLVSALGLAGGWMLSNQLASPFLAPIAAMRNRLEGTFDELAVDPILGLATQLERFDRLIHRGVLGLGGLGLRIAGTARTIDNGDQRAVDAAGRAALHLASGSRTTDEAGIERLIHGLINSIRQTGSRARELQTGLISRELAFTAGSIVVLLVILLAATIVST